MRQCCLLASKRTYIISRKGWWIVTLRAASLLLCSVVAVTWMAVPSIAHHSFTMFDLDKKITLTGTVTSFEWTNPHAYIEVDVPSENGEVKHWSIEMGSPSILMRSGWKANSLKAGDKATLIVNPLKSGQAGGFLFYLTLPDGRVLGNGPGRGPQP
jgi:hypothetical protein